jgi:uncharacterized lipoprotein YddW (UPF0748 family)
MKKYLRLFLVTTASLLLVVAKAQPLVQTKSLKGVWLTNTGSDAMYTQKGIDECVDICAKSGIGHIFMVTWNRGVTQWKSPLMKKLFGIEMDTTLKGFDPLAALIKAAHKKKIKVHAWMEFGFSNALEGSGDFILQKFPHWASIDKHRGVLNDNDFSWMNPFHPEVRQFIKDLILDLMANYDIDGIQGDDRLPALPVAGGYDDYTVQWYRSEHNGNFPPQNEKDSAWVQWRCDKLSAYVQELFKAVKQAKPKCMFTLAPSVYPWGKLNYLQDWPQWLRDGYVDAVFPQVYRYNMEYYNNALREMVQQSKDYFNKVSPGVLIALGNGYLVDKKILAEMVKANRKAGLKGEIFFYYDGVKRLKDFFIKEYPKLR